MIDFVESCLTTGVSRDYKQLSDVFASVVTAFSQWRQPLTQPPPGEACALGAFWPRMRQKLRAI